MKINIILENGAHITKDITEHTISKQELFLKYLDGYIDMDEWYITYNGVKQPVQEFYEDDKDYFFNQEYEYEKLGLIQPITKKHLEKKKDLNKKR